MSTVLIPEEISLIFNSDPSLGNIQVIGTTGSRFQVKYPSPVSIPKGCESPSIELVSANIWNDVPNIITGTNDRVTITVSGVDQLITIPQGSYSVEDMNTYINAALKAINATWIDIFTLAPDYPTGKTKVTSNNAIFDAFKTQGSAREIAFGVLIGWTADQAYTTVGEVYFGSAVANINVVDNFLIHLSMLAEGLPINGQYSDIIASVPITRAPGSLIVYEPQNPTKLEVPNLINSSNTTYTTYITNQSNVELTMPSYWSFQVKISWLRPLITERKF